MKNYFSLVCYCFFIVKWLSNDPVTMIQSYDLIVDWFMCVDLLQLLLLCFICEASLWLSDRSCYFLLFIGSFFVQDKINRGEWWCFNFYHKLCRSCTVMLFVSYLDDFLIRYFGRCLLQVPFCIGLKTQLVPVYFIFTSIVKTWTCTM